MNGRSVARLVLAGLGVAVLGSVAGAAWGFVGGAFVLGGFAFGLVLALDRPPALASCGKCGRPCTVCKTLQPGIRRRGVH